MSHQPTNRWLLLLGLLTSLVVPAHAGAQTGTTVTGTTQAGGAPVSGVSVVLESARGSFQAKSDASGRFSIPSVPDGTYHLEAHAPGFLVTSADITVGPSLAPLAIRLVTDPHVSEVVSVSPDPRSPFESYQPVSALGGQDLSVKVQSSLGATLGNEAGVSVRSFGPGPSRPVIRGLDGDRVLVLEDGNRMGDLSSQSGDHGVNVNPASASRIEVVRGPATLLYGANAIGGLVNVITNAIPTTPVARPTGTVAVDLASAAGEAGGAADITAGRGPLAVHLSASGRRAGDYHSPEGDVPNSFSRGAFVEGGVSYVRDHGYVGVSGGYDRTHYGIPFVEEGETNLNPRRKLFDLRAERSNLSGLINSVRLSFGVRRYIHNELDGEEIATTFVNNTADLNVLARHRAVGRLTGTVGGQVLTRFFSAQGEESLSPDVDQRGAAVFLFEEASLSQHVQLQFGGRVDHARFAPAQDLPARAFTNISGSFGLLAHPSDATTIAVSVASASRNPALEELYFRGPHPGNFAVENGNEDLKSERGLGVDVSFRWKHERASGDVTVFANRVRDFIYRELTGEVDDEEGLPITAFAQSAATLTGVEGHLDVKVTERLWTEAGLDLVRGRLTDLGVALPRMPPMRGRLGLRYQRNAFQAGVQGVVAAAQDRLFTRDTLDGAVGETATDGYTLAKLFVAWSFAAGRSTHTIAARLENAGNVSYRNHLNYLKDLVPEVGRDFRVTYTVGF